MYKGRVEGVSINKNAFLADFKDDVLSRSWRVSHNVLTTTTLQIAINPAGT